MPKCTKCRKLVPLGLAVALRCVGCSKDHCSSCHELHSMECPHFIEISKVKKHEYEKKILDGATLESKLNDKL